MQANDPTPSSSGQSNFGAESAGPDRSDPQASPYQPPHVRAEAVDAEFMEDVPAKPLRPPHPNFLVAILWSLLLMFAQLVVGLGLSFVAAIAFVVLTGNPREVEGFLGGSFQLVLLPVGTVTTLLLALAVVFCIHGRQAPRLIGCRGISWQQGIWVLLIVGPLAVLASEVTNCMALVLPLFEPEWLRAFREQGSEMFLLFNEQAFALVFVVGCLLPGLGEEIYCRGFLSRGLVGRYGIVTGTLMTAFLFGAMHVDPVQSSGAFFLGVGLQLVFLTTRSLLAPIILHTFNNALAFATMRFSDDFPIPGLTPMPDGTVLHTPLPLLITAGFALIALSVLLVQSRTQWILPDGSSWSPGYVSAESPPQSIAAEPVSGRPVVWLVALGLLSYAGMLAALVLAANAAS